MLLKFFNPKKLKIIKNFHLKNRKIKLNIYILKIYLKAKYL